MTNNARVFNVSRGYTLKHRQAVKAVEECSCAWVEFGISVRDLSLAESIAKRADQEKSREPLPCAELPGLIYRAAPRNETATRQEMTLATEANQWARLIECR